MIYSMRKLFLLLILVILFGVVESKATDSDSSVLMNHIDSIHAIAEDAFNDRCFKEAMMYEGCIPLIVPSDSATLQCIVASKSNSFLYGAQFLPIDSVWEYANAFVMELTTHRLINIPEYYTLQLRTAYLNALREDGEANVSIANSASEQIKRLNGSKSEEYAEALLLQSVILLRSIPSFLEGENKESQEIKHKREKDAEKAINQAISIYKKLGVSHDYTWPAYASAMKEMILLRKHWHWHGGIGVSPHSAVEEFGIASNVEYRACAKMNAIYNSILEGCNKGDIMNAISAIENLIKVHRVAYGPSKIESRLLLLGSFCSLLLNDTSGAQRFLEKAQSINKNVPSAQVYNDTILSNFSDKITENTQRLDLLYEEQPLKGFEEALLTLGSPNYYYLIHQDFQDDLDNQYWFAPMFDNADRNLNFPNLIREFIGLFSNSPSLDSEFLSQFGLSARIKEKYWNKHIDPPVLQGTTIWGGLGDEVYHFDTLNQFLKSPLEKIYNFVIQKSNKTYQDYQTLSRCSFYLFDFDKAVSYEQLALNTLLENHSGDSHEIMECQKRVAYLLMLDFWYDSWLYSEFFIIGPKLNAKMQRRMSKRGNFLRKYPQVMNQKFSQLVDWSKKISYEAIPYLYNLLPNLGKEERLELWKDFSGWFYSLMPMLILTPGMEEAVYDAQLFAKGLLLDTSRTSAPQQYSWKDVRKGLKGDEIAIEFIEAGDGYYGAVIKADSNTPQIFPLFSNSDFELVSKDMGLYLSSAGYNLVFAPLALSDTISTIYFSPTGLLNSMAIESFCDKTGKLASDKWKLVRLSTTKELVKEHTKTDFNHIVLYGGLDYNRRDALNLNSGLSRTGERKEGTCYRYLAREDLRYGVDSLKWSLPEVTAISSLYKDKSPDTEISLFTAASGIEESVHLLQEKRPSIIHFSTHGYYWTKEEREKRNYVSFFQRTNLEDENPIEQSMLYSGLFLSGANSGLKGEELPEDVEDGILTAKELADLNFSQTDFVALSACQSGLGVINGEGVFGLQRGFKLAGVKSILMSLWPVHDKATELLMIEFYRNMLNGDNKQSALNKAKKYIKEYKDVEDDFADPEYWAGWVLLDALD